MKPAIKDKNTFLLALAVILIILAVVFWVLIFNNIVVLKKEILTLAVQLNSIERKMRNTKDIETFVRGLKTEKETIESSIIMNQDDLATLIEQIESLASKANVTYSIESIQTPHNQESSPLLSIKAGGDFNEIYYFMDMLENNQHLLSINNLVLKKEEQEKAKLASNKWEAEINLAILSYKSK